MSQLDHHTVLANKILVCYVPVSSVQLQIEVVLVVCPSLLQHSILSHNKDAVAIFQCPSSQLTLVVCCSVTWPQLEVLGRMWSAVFSSSLCLAVSSCSSSQCAKFTTTSPAPQVLDIPLDSTQVFHSSIIMYRKFHPSRPNRMMDALLIDVVAPVPSALPVLHQTVLLDRTGATVKCPHW